MNNDGRDKRFGVQGAEGRWGGPSAPPPPCHMTPPPRLLATPQTGPGRGQSGHAHNLRGWAGWGRDRRAGHATSAGSSIVRLPVGVGPASLASYVSTGKRGADSLSEICVGLVASGVTLALVQSSPARGRLPAGRGGRSFSGTEAARAGGVRGARGGAAPRPAPRTATSPPEQSGWPVAASAAPVRVGGRRGVGDARAGCWCRCSRGARAGSTNAFPSGPRSASPVTRARPPRSPVRTAAVVEPGSEGRVAVPLPLSARLGLGARGARAARAHLPRERTCGLALVEPTSAVSVVRRARRPGSWVQGKSRRVPRRCARCVGDAD